VQRSSALLRHPDVSSSVNWKHIPSETLNPHSLFLWLQPRECTPAISVCSHTLMIFVRVKQAGK